MRHCIVVPVIHAETTKGFANSCSDETLERVIFIDNSDDGSCVAAVSRPFKYSVRMNRNAGVAASWNLGVHEALLLGADFVTLCSAAVRFEPDGGAALCRTADLASENEQWPYGFESMMGWKCITLGADTFGQVGFFDENFYPAYFEDNDYIWRMRCAGILEPAGTSRSTRKIPWVGALKYEVTEDAHALKHAGVKVDFASLEKYYVSKWGGPPGEEKTCTPLT